MSDVQIAVIDQQDTQIALAVPGVQGPMGPAFPANAIPDGTAAAPGVSFTNDPDTGIFRPGANRFAFTTGGVLRNEVNEQGNFVYYGDAIFQDGSSFQTTLQTVTPTVNRTISFPDATGTVALVAGSSGQLLYNASGANAGASTLTYDGSILTSSGRFINSYNATASSPAKAFTGTWFTGGTSTTTKPQVVIEPTGTTSTSWSTSGTGLGVNAASGFVGRLLDLQLNGTSNFNVDSTGRVSFPLGAVGTPSLYPGADTNTGFWSPAADTLAASTNGTERARIDSSGRVGIGTSSPQVPLDLIADASGYGIVLRGRSADGLGQLRFTSNNYATVYSELISTSSALAVNVNGSERARIDSSGRLLVGTSSASILRYGSNTAKIETNSVDYHLAMRSDLNANGAPFATFVKTRANAIVQSGDAIGAFEWRGHDGTDAESVAATIEVLIDGTPGSNDMPGRLVFSTTADGSASPTERMRIDNAGNVLINTTSASAFFDGRLRVLHSATGASFSTTGSAGAFAQTLWHQATTGDNAFLSFGTETTHAQRGTITYNRAGGLVAYNTTSDYRAKTLLGDIDNSGETIDALKIYRGVMNGATVERPMLVAHEAQEVAPYCVTGEKDAVDDDGNPIYQQMDHQALVPLLIAEIQQLRTRVAALEGA